MNEYIEEMDYMDINEKMLMDLAEQAGVRPRHGKEIKQAEQMAGRMRGKNEDEILSEILRLKEGMKKDPAAYQKQINAVRALRGMMNPEQRARLDRVLELLER